MSRHHSREHCLQCLGEIPSSRRSNDPPEFWDCDVCKSKFLIQSGIGSAYDIVWPEPSFAYNPCLAIIRAGPPDTPGARAIYRIKLKPKEIDQDLWDRKEKKPKI